MLAIEYNVNIWQVSPRLSCGGTCQVWMLSKEYNKFFLKIENFAYGEIKERSFSNPHPWSQGVPLSLSVYFIGLILILKKTFLTFFLKKLTFL